MSLLELLFGRVESKPEQPMRPRPVAADESSGGFCALCDGQLLVMQDIPDPVFASGALGPAVAIVPADNVENLTLYAPASGTITVLTATLHALGMRTDDGIELLIHAGVDTVNLRGEGFCGYVDKGQHVRAGEALMTVDLAKVRQAGYGDAAIMALTNVEVRQATVCASRLVKAGEPVMSVAQES